MGHTFNYNGFNITPFPSFLNGTYGIASTLLKLHEITREEKYLVQALSISFIRPERTILYEYFNGLSGAVIPLMNLLKVKEDTKILELLKYYIELLTNGFRHHQQGVYWDRSYHNANVLSGFANGNSGIAFALLELGPFLNCKTFFRLAEQALLFEALSFDTNAQNWKDQSLEFSSLNDSSTAFSAYKNNNISYFTPEKYHASWENGYIGIGLTRLRAYELLKNEKYSKEAKIAINHCINGLAETKNLSLNNGLAGKGELLLKAFAVYGKRKYLDNATCVAKTIIDNTGVFLSKRKQEDLSLYSGMSGVGYFLLRFLAPEKTNSVLLPEIRSKAKRKFFSSLKIDEKTLFKINLSNSFPRTISVLNKISSTSEKKIIADLSEHSNFLKNAEKRIDEEILKLGPKIQERIKEIFTLETRKRNTENEITSFAYLHIKDLYQALNSWEKLSTRLSKLKFKVSDGCKMNTLSWSWPLGNMTSCLQNLEKEAENFNVLFRNSSMGVIEHQISDFSFAIVEFFEKPGTLDDCVNFIAKANEIEESGQLNVLREKVVAQLKELYVSCMIGLDNIEPIVSFNEILNSDNLPSSYRITEMPPEDLCISIIIPCFYEPDLIKTLESLWNCSKPDCGVEISIVINSSEVSDESIIDLLRK